MEGKNEDKEHSPYLEILEFGGDVMLISILSMILAISPQKNGDNVGRP